MSTSTPTIPDYELIRELGVGGMATVWLAVQRSLDRKVAIKVMKRNIDDLEKFERRFLQEGRTMAKLPHRNIVAVYDIKKTEELTYIAMEYLDGGTLSTMMKQGLSLAEAISVVVQIGHALQFAHEHGVVHRDLKPANIMFRDEHTPVLTDFGIAKQQDQSATRLTQTGMLVGTPTYMSPEQINALDVDGRSDLYSLGILFYELLTGQPPFSADTPIAVLMAHLTTPPPALPPQFADFQPVLDKMLAKSRDDRFVDLKEFARALKGAVTNNENLLARLQSDPNQSSSEQLRALGFSMSGPSTDSLSRPGVSQQIRLPPSGRVQRTPTPGPASLRVPQPDQSSGYVQGPERRAPWGMIGGIAAVLVAVVIAAVLFWPKPDIDPAVKALVDGQLGQVRSEIQGKNLSKAREALLVAMQVAPNYEGTLAVRGELAKALKDEAKTKLAANDFDGATVPLEQVKGLTPEDAELAAITQQIDAGRKRAADVKALTDLVARADRAIKSGKDLGAGGAYPLLMQARNVAPRDPQIKARLDALLLRALKPARDALARNDLKTALDAVRLTEAELGKEPPWQVLKAEVDGAIVKQERRQRVQTVLLALDSQLQRGRLLDPPGDNARESLAAAIAIDDKDPDVLRRQDALARALTDGAQRSIDARAFEQALQAADAALGVKADFAAAATIKRTAESSLGAQRTKVIETLNAAQRAIAEQRFLAPASPNARTLIEEVLRLDPQNATAQTLLGDLPKRIVEAAQARSQSGDLAGAARLVDDARRVYASDTQLAALSQRLQQDVAAAKAVADRNARYERINQLIAAQPLSADNAGAAARDIAALLAADARDVDAATAKQRLFAAINDVVVAAQEPADLEAAAAAFRQVQGQFASDPAAARLGTDIDATRQRLVAEEQQRIAAISGELVLNAYPWATVDSVVDAQNKPVPLQGDTTTPYRMTLPQGVYYVRFKHPQGGTSGREVANVKAKQTVTLNTSFAGAVTSKDYLKRAGW